MVAYSFSPVSPRMPSWQRVPGLFGIIRLKRDFLSDSLNISLSILCVCKDNCILNSGNRCCSLPVPIMARLLFCAKNNCDRVDHQYCDSLFVSHPAWLSTGRYCCNRTGYDDHHRPDKVQNITGITGDVLGRQLNYRNVLWYWLVHWPFV